MRFVLSLICVFCLMASGLQAQTVPEWVRDRFCENWADPATCRASVVLEPKGGGEGDMPRLAHCDYITVEQRWDFSDPCFSTVRVNAFASIVTYRMQNGSTVGLMESDNGLELNGQPAREVTHQGKACYEVIETKEKFCVSETRAAAAKSIGDARLSGLWLSSQDLCETPELLRRQGEYAEFKSVEGVGLVLYTGDYAAEGGRCEIASAVSRGTGILAQARCFEEEFDAGKAQIYFDFDDTGRKMLIWNWRFNASRAFYRCD